MLCRAGTSVPSAVAPGQRRAIAASFVLSEPGVLPGDGDCIQVAADASRDALGPDNLQRLSLIEWKRKRRTDARIFLPICVGGVVYNRPAAAKKGGITRYPHSRAECVNQSTLK